MRFDWDPAKNERNEQKHKVSFVEALAVFTDPLARIFDDPDHSVGEPREIIVGHSRRGRLLLVCFVERGDVIRIFSARKVTTHERKDYQENRPVGD